jgi:hypothetical protein
MAREYHAILVAVLICVVLTGTVAVYILLMDRGGTHEQPLPATAPAPVRHGAPGTPVTTGSPVPGGPRSFSISVTPTAATARSGDTVRFTLTVHPENGFAAPVQIAVTATALGGAYRDSRDLATISPPYPPLRYEIVAPALPPLVSTATVDATVTASGGGLVQTEQVQLVIRR